MPYFIETWDKPNHQHVRDRARAEHLAFLEANKHRLLACGAKLTADGAGATGGVYILDTESQEEAEQFLAADPFSGGGAIRFSRGDALAQGLLQLRELHGAVGLGRTKLRHGSSPLP